LGSAGEKVVAQWQNGEGGGCLEKKDRDSKG
jgi:hypothetical protein